MGLYTVLYGLMITMLFYKEIHWNSKSIYLAIPYVITLYLLSKTKNLVLFFLTLHLCFFPALLWFKGSEGRIFEKFALVVCSAILWVFFLLWTWEKRKKVYFNLSLPWYIGAPKNNQHCLAFSYDGEGGTKQEWSVQKMDIYGMVLSPQFVGTVQPKAAVKFFDILAQGEKIQVKGKVRFFEPRTRQCGVEFLFEKLSDQKKVGDLYESLYAKKIFKS